MGRPHVRPEMTADSEPQATRDTDRAVAAAAPPTPSTSAASPGAGLRPRIEAIDLARGLAVCLMIVAHGTNGLLPYSDFPDWGQVPVHAITKFSSSLFFVVFGIALAVAFVPKTSAPDWPRRRNHLLWRGLVVLFWYKVLTVVGLWDRGRDGIVDALLYRDFPRSSKSSASTRSRCSGSRGCCRCGPGHRPGCAG